MSSFFRKNFGARYLIDKYQRLITCRLCNEGLLISFFIHGHKLNLQIKKLHIYIKLLRKFKTCTS